MTRWTDHNDTESMVMLQQAADAEGLPEYAVEKDWWVTMVLKAMFQTSVAEWLDVYPAGPLPMIKHFTCSIVVIGFGLHWFQVV